MRKLNCWEFNNCGRAFEGESNSAIRTCPASVEIMLDGIHGGARAGRACWIVADTVCKGKSMGTYSRKQGSCKKCAFYKAVKQEEGNSFMPVAEILDVAGSGSPTLRARHGQNPELSTACLEKDFGNSLCNTLKLGQEACGYSEARLLHMIRDMGPRQAVKKILNRQQFLYGTSELARHNCLQYSVERLVLDYRYSGIFSEEERMAALMRIRNAGVGKLEKLLLGTDMNTVIEL